MHDRGTVEQRFEAALENAERFFMKTGKVHQAALALVRRLDQADIPYATPGPWRSALTGTSVSRLTWMCC
jgi:hypothetical protein